MFPRVSCELIVMFPRVSCELIVMFPRVSCGLIVMFSLTLPLLGEFLVGSHLGLCQKGHTDVKISSENLLTV